MSRRACVRVRDRSQLAIHESKVSTRIDVAITSGYPIHSIAAIIADFDAVAPPVTYMGQRFRSVLKNVANVAFRRYVCALRKKCHSLSLVSNRRRNYRFELSRANSRITRCIACMTIVDCARTHLSTLHRSRNCRLAFRTVIAAHANGRCGREKAD